jgi:hypothetical protein
MDEAPALCLPGADGERRRREAAARRRPAGCLRPGCAPDGSGGGLAGCLVVLPVCHSHVRWPEGVFTERLVSIDDMLYELSDQCVGRRSAWALTPGSRGGQRRPRVRSPASGSRVDPLAKRCTPASLRDWARRSTVPAPLTAPRRRQASVPYLSRSNLRFWLVMQPNLEFGVKCTFLSLQNCNEHQNAIHD